jgi:hypothetical protein
MLTFIILSLGLSFMVQTESSLLRILLMPIFMYAGIFFAVISALGVYFKKQMAICYDLFFSSALVIWFTYWRPMPLFTEDSPVFFVFPLYFVFMATFMQLFFIGNRHKTDAETLLQIKSLANRHVPTWVLMLGILVSLRLLDHYLLFPVLMTLLMIQYVLFCFQQAA